MAEPAEYMRSIQRISAEDANRISTAQVITQLSTAVKELVENALDAGATTVEVRLRDYGAESIEVVDNGSGIKPEDFKNLTAKGATSKIRAFDDIYAVSTHGFRGEALASLCELAGGLTVVTRAEGQRVGTALRFDRAGRITASDPRARNRGTTVTVSRLFEPLPVRHREFLRNRDAQYRGMLRAMEAYALISAGCRILVSNTVTGATAAMAASYNVTAVPAASQAATQPAAAAARDVLRTSGGAGGLADNIVDVFGKKFFDTLVKIDVDLTEAVAAAAAPDNAADAGDTDGPTSVPSATQAAAAVALTQRARIYGFVSRFESGVATSGKTDKSRQFLFLNSRPVDIPAISNAVRDAWRQFERLHHPAAILDLTLPPGTWDINITPDKRAVLLTHERAIASALETALKELWEPGRRTFEVAPMITSTLSFAPSPAPAPAPAPASASLSARSVSASASQRPASASSIVGSLALEAPGSAANASSNRPSSAASSVATVRSDVESLASPAVQAAPQQQRSQQQQQQHSSGTPSSTATPGATATAATTPTAADDMAERLAKRQQLVEALTANGGVKMKGKKSAAAAVSISEIMAARKQRLAEPTASTNLSAQQPRPIVTSHAHSHEGQPVDDDEDFLNTQDAVDQDESAASPGTDDVEFVSDAPSSASAGRKRPRNDDSVAASAQFESVDLLAMKAYYAAKRNKLGCTALSSAVATAAVGMGDGGISQSEAGVDSAAAASASTATYVTTAAALGGTTEGVSLAACADAPQQKSAAEAALSRVLHQKEFTSMSERVVGQFNLGFIIAALGSDLFILDQHACDEKWRYERLVTAARVTAQPLIAPLPLELTAAEECVVRDHIDIFRANGFEFAFAEDAPSGASSSSTGPRAGSRLSLTRVPLSRAAAFGESDVRELVSRIEEAGLLPGDGEGEAVGEGAVRPRRAVFLPRADDIMKSRACHDAARIGDALSRRKAADIVAHLAGMRQPWNCPHGRPTMRHLVDVDAVARAGALAPAGPEYQGTIPVSTAGAADGDAGIS